MDRLRIWHLWIVYINIADMGCLSICLIKIVFVYSIIHSLCQHLASVDHLSFFANKDHLGTRTIGDVCALGKIENIKLEIVWDAVVHGKCR